MKDFTELSGLEKSQIFDQFVRDLEEINRKSGTIFGTVQILERFERIAIQKGFIECPYCKQKAKK